MLLALILLMALLITIGWYYWNNYRKPVTTQQEGIKEGLLHDSILQRMLAIETLTSSNGQETTYHKIKEEAKSLTHPLSISLGSTTAQKIGVFLNRRNEILKEYYLALRDSPPVDDIVINKRLEIISRDITDTIATSFQIHEVDRSSDKTVSVKRYQRLYNLLVIYDKELINQARSYASHYYEISLNSSKSCLEVVHHIAQEIYSIVQENSKATR